MSATSENSYIRVRCVIFVLEIIFVFILVLVRENIIDGMLHCLQPRPIGCCSVVYRPEFYYEDAVV